MKRIYLILLIILLFSFFIFVLKKQLVLKDTQIISVKGQIEKPETLNAKQVTKANDNLKPAEGPSLEEKIKQVEAEIRFYDFGLREVRPAVKSALTVILGKTGKQRTQSLYSVLLKLPHDLTCREITLLLGKERAKLRANLLELLLTRTKQRSLNPRYVTSILGIETRHSRSKLIATLALYMKPPLTVNQAVDILGQEKETKRLNCLRPIAALIKRPLSEEEVSRITAGISKESEARKVLFGADDLSEKFVKAKVEM